MTVPQTLWLFLPAFIANGAPVLLVRIPFLARRNAPLWERGLGDHKTWVGFLGGIIVGGLTGLIQWVLSGMFPALRLELLASPLTTAGIGLLLGAGALTGDAVKSYVKRGMGIEPGSALPVGDGMDHILGAMLFLAPFFVPPPRSILALLIVSPLLSLAANIFSYLLGWKRRWY